MTLLEKLRLFVERLTSGSKNLVSGLRSKDERNQVFRRGGGIVVGEVAVDCRGFCQRIINLVSGLNEELNR